MFLLKVKNVPTKSQFLTLHTRNLGAYKTTKEKKKKKKKKEKKTRACMHACVYIKKIL